MYSRISKTFFNFINSKQQFDAYFTLRDDNSSIQIFRKLLKDAITIESETGVSELLNYIRFEKFRGPVFDTFELIKQAIVLKNMNIIYSLLSASGDISMFKNVHMVLDNDNKKGPKL